MSNATLVTYGSHLTLKSKVEETFLHSNGLNYPMLHNDGKISSQGQQVTGNRFASNQSNQWIIVPASWYHLGFTQQALSKISPSQGDFVRLKHVQTGRYLASTLIAAPLDEDQQEIQALEWSSSNDLYTGAKTLWRLEIYDCDHKKGLTSHLCSIRLLHSQTGAYLFNNRKKLPSWANGDREITGVDMDEDMNPSVWIIYDVKHPQNNNKFVIDVKKGRTVICSTFLTISITSKILI